jgi:hypothetical protein
MIFKAIAVFENDELLHTIQNSFSEKIAKRITVNFSHNQNEKNILIIGEYKFFIYSPRSDLDKNQIFKEISSLFSKHDNSINFEFLQELSELLDNMEKEEKAPIKRTTISRSSIEKQNLSYLMKNDHRKKLALDYLYNLTETTLMKNQQPSIILKKLYYKKKTENSVSLYRNSQRRESTRKYLKENEDDIKILLHEKMMKKKTIEETFIDEEFEENESELFSPKVVYKELMKIKVDNINISDKEIIGEIEVTNLENDDNYYFEILNTFWTNSSVVNVNLNSEEIIKKNDGILFSNKKKLEEKLKLLRYVINPNLIDKETIPLVIGFNKTPNILYIKLKLNPKYNKQIFRFEVKIEFLEEILQNKISCTHYGKLENNLFKISLDKKELFHERVLIKIAVDFEKINFTKIYCDCIILNTFIPNLSHLMKNVDNDITYQDFEKFLKINYVINI